MKKKFLFLLLMIMTCCIVGVNIYNNNKLLEKKLFFSGNVSLGSIQYSYEIENETLYIKKSLFHKVILRKYFINNDIQVTSKLTIDKDYLFFTGINKSSDEAFIYELNLKSNELKTIKNYNKYGLKNMEVKAGKVYYCINSFIYSMNIDGTNEMKIVNDEVLDMAVGEEYIVYLANDSDTDGMTSVYKLNLNDYQKEKVSNDSMSNLVIQDNFVYYTNVSLLSTNPLSKNPRGIYRLNIDTHEIEKILEVNARRLVVGRGRVYYNVYGKDENVIYELQK